MLSPRTFRPLATQVFPRPTPARQCATPRCYATQPKPTPKATAAKLNNVKKRAASRKIDLEENESLAARTPFKKPTTDGLGVPSASPSATSTSASPASTGTSAETRNVGSEAAEWADAQTALRKEELLKRGRQARMDKEREEEARREGEKGREEKRRKLKGGYLRVVVGVPFVGILSWELWQRCKFGLRWSWYGC